MKLIFALSVLVLGLGYMVPLLPLPFGSVENYAALLINSWFQGLGLLAFNIFFGTLLLRIEKHWITIALFFCLAQVLIWWWLSGLFAINVPTMKFLGLKLLAIQDMLHHPSVKVVFVTIHQEIVVGVFYHLALLCFLIVIGNNKGQTKINSLQM